MTLYFAQGENSRFPEVDPVKSESDIRTLTYTLGEKLFVDAKIFWAARKFPSKWVGSTRPISSKHHRNDLSAVGNSLLVWER